MNILLSDLLGVGPFAIISLAGMVVLVVDSLGRETETLSCWIAGIGLLVALGVALMTIGNDGIVFMGMVNAGGFGSFLSVVFCVSGLLTVLLSRSYIKEEGIEHGEYYALLLFAVSGMMIMASAADLIIFFVGLEIMSVCFYILAGFARKRMVSNEAALKYFLLGAFATGFLLYGIALVYGSTGTTSTGTILLGVSAQAANPLFLIGLALLLVGLLFKVAAVPFHMWVPDVYEGAPTTVTGFMSTAGKAAAFSVFLILFVPKLLLALPSLRDVLAVIAALSMIVGNVIAVAQTSVKRMLAYSSIAHAGYILTGIVAANASGGNGVLFYLLAYTVMNTGAFGVLAMLESPTGGHLTFDDYAGLSKKSPFVAGIMALFMFSLSGIPPFAGFFGKYYVFAGAIQSGFTWLAIIGVLTSAVSVYYYLRIVVVMYFRDGSDPAPATIPRLGMIALGVSAV